MEKVVITRHPGSYRDPSGFIFTFKNEFYRAVQPSYRPHYERLIRSGLYDELVKNNLLIPHKEVKSPPGINGRVERVLKPKRIEFTSYPYEWCFSAFKDAALLVLDIARRSLKYGLVLKDGNAFNVMFDGCHPIFIDSLSFEIYREGNPWSGYRQFCEQFLAPLALASTLDVRILQFSRTYFYGIPLDLVTQLLPRSTLVRLGLLLHLHLHAWSQRRYKKGGKAIPKGQLTSVGLNRLFENLSETVTSLRWKPPHDTWTTYYQGTNYSDRAFTTKKRLVEKFIDQTKPKMIWDLGANTGSFSQLAVERGIYVIAMDNDYGTVDLAYQGALTRGYKLFLPLVVDLLNPSPGLGWMNKERANLAERSPVDSVLALALIHHLAIGSNVPLSNIADFLSTIGHHVLVEFIPKEDSRVRHLLETRRDIFTDYHRRGFESAISEYFTIRWQRELPESKRVIYALEKRAD